MRIYEFLFSRIVTTGLRVSRGVGWRDGAIEDTSCCVLVPYIPFFFLTFYSPSYDMRTWHDALSAIYMILTYFASCCNYMLYRVLPIHI